MADKRRCVVSDMRGKIDGFFIQYGTQIIYDDGNNPLQRTTAIVEADDGRVLEVEPMQVRFVAED